jgi:hypothetical protein
VACDPSNRVGLKEARFSTKADDAITHGAQRVPQVENLGAFWFTAAITT